MSTLAGVRSVVAAFLAAGAALPAAGQHAPGSALGKLGEHVIGVRDGLPAEQVLGFHEDARGAVWIGTVDGLARLSGPEVRVYDVRDGLPRKVVYAVAEDAAGVLFAGTVNGVARYDAAADRFTGSGLDAGGRVRALLRGGAQGRDLYAVLLPSRVYRRRDGAWAACPLRGVPDGAVVNGAAFDERGRLLAATRGHGLLLLEPDGDGFRLAQRWDGAPHFPDGFAFHVVSREGQIVATSRHGLVTIDAQGVRSVDLPGSVGLRPMAMGSDGTVYAASDAGLFRLRDGVLEALEGLRSLRDVNPVALMVDRSGNLWCGTVARGALVLRTNLPVRHYLGPGGIPGDQVLTVAPLEPGRVWVFTDRGGFEVRHEPDGRVAGMSPVDPARPIGRSGGEAFLRLSDDEALVGTWDGIGRVTGIRDPQRRRFDVDKRFASLRSVYVPGLARGADGAVWVGTAEGLHVLPAGGTLRRVRLGTSDADRVRGVVALDSGPVVVLTSTGEVFGVRSAADAAGVRLEVPALGRELASGPDGRAWLDLDDGSTRVFGAGSDGSVRVERELSADGPLAGLSVLSLTRLPDGGWLAAHAAGVGRLDPVRMIETERWLSASDLDGAPTRRLAAVADVDGSVWLAGLRVLARFTPAGFRPPPPPVLLIERLTVDGSAIEPPADGALQLGASHLVELALALPEPTAPRTAEFRYRLGGEEDPWSAWSSTNHFRFGTLRQGFVRLDIEGRDRLGRAARPVVLRFHVAAPWWRSTPAVAAWMALAAAAAALYVRTRTRELVRRQAELERRVAGATRDLAEANVRLASSNDALRKLDEVRREFLAIAAHDLRNPLTVVSGTAELLLDQARRAEAGSPVARDVEESAEFIRRNARQMSAIVGHLLETASLEGDDVRLDLAEVDVGELAGRVCEAQGAAAGKKRIRITATRDGDVRARVDEVRLQEVLENLVGNAVKFSPPGGTVTVAVAPAEEPDRILVSVRDEGPGLTAEDKARLFGRFQRLTARPTGGETSTGLGLFIVRRLVELHGGRVWAEGEAGVGTTFKVELLRTPTRP